MQSPNKCYIERRSIAIKLFQEIIFDITETIENSIDVGKVIERNKLSDLIRIFL